MKCYLFDKKEEKASKATRKGGFAWINPPPPVVIKQTDLPETRNMKIFSFLIEMLSVASRLDRAYSRSDMENAEQLIDGHCTDSFNRPNRLDAERQTAMVAQSMPGRV